MKVNGFQLQAALKDGTSARNLLNSRLSSMLHRFEDSPEEPQSYEEAAKDLFRLETNLAKLQVLQARFNLEVQVPLPMSNKTISLMEAVKRVGGADRVETLWKDAAVETTSTSYRDKDWVMAKRTIPLKTCLDKAQQAHKFTSSLRQAIQVGNATEVEFKDIEPSLFDFHFGGSN